MRVQACPVGAPDNPERKAINLAARAPLVEAERDNVAFFETLPVADRSRVDFGTVRGIVQFLQPLFRLLRRLRQLRRDAVRQAACRSCSATG